MSINQTELIDEMQREIDMLHAENALKLTQILDLEQLLYIQRVSDEEDGSPCWCRVEGIGHTASCYKARQATEPFWKK